MNQFPKLMTVLVGLVILSPSVFAGSGRAKPAPAYYTYQDLLNATQTYSRDMWYDNMSYSPNNDVALIPQYPVGGSAIASTKLKSTIIPAKAPRTISYVRRPKRRPGQPTSSITTQTTYINWPSDGSQKVPFDQLAGCAGDLIFVRGKSKGEKLVSEYFSSWTHVAMIWSTTQHKVLESMEKGGVQVNDAHESWANTIAFATKSVDPNKVGYFEWTQEDGNGKVVNYIGSNHAYQAIIAANRNYSGTLYWPQSINKNAWSTKEFWKKWSDINDHESMYCSKLVYQTFKDHNSSVNLDSNRTKIYIPGLANSDWSWIGVSPDDIWGSSDTTEAWEFYGQENLTRALN